MEKQFGFIINPFSYSNHNYEYILVSYSGILELMKFKYQSVIYGKFYIDPFYDCMDYEFPYHYYIRQVDYSGTKSILKSVIPCPI